MAAKRDDKDVRQTISSIVERLRIKYDPEKIFLYGSFGYGIPHEDSDIDILIVKNTEERPIDRRIAVRRIISDLRHGFPFSSIVLTEGEIKSRLAAGDQFLQEILSRGEVLYAR